MKSRLLLAFYFFILASDAFGAYQPDGEAFVCVNGTNRFTRALYGSCAASRIETSDIPEASLYLSSKESYTIEFPELAKFEKVVSRYEKGVRSYVLTDGHRLGRGRLEVTITAVAEGDGGVVKIEGFDLTKPYAVKYIEGRMRAKKLFRDGDYGRDPSSSFFVNDKDRKNVKTVEVRNGKPTYLCLPATLNLQPSTAFSAGVTYAAKVANRLVIKTPDPYIKR